MFDLKKQTVSMTNFNPRSELNGDARRPAADINCRAQFPNSILDEFFPGLLAMLYAAPTNPDLAEQADPDKLTALRMPLLGLPLKWALVLENRKLTIDYGLGGDSDLVMPESKVHKFSIEPQQGGTVLLEWQISAHPDPAQAGWLYDHQQQDIVISLEAQPEAQASLLTDGPKKSKKEKQEEARAAAEAAFVATSDKPTDEKPPEKTLLNPAAAWPFPTPKKDEPAAA